MNEYESKKPQNATGLPVQLKTGVEAMSGFSMDDVRVHYNSSKPAQMKALAYTQGTDIHVAPGQEQHLGHEAWHVVQQKQGRVAPTTQLKGMNVNTDSGLEHEADVMGARAAAYTTAAMPVVQRKAAASQQDAPMQFWGLDQHEWITMVAARLAGYKFSDDQNQQALTELPTSLNLPRSQTDNNDFKQIKALQVGAAMNDIYANSGSSTTVSRISENNLSGKMSNIITNWDLIKFLPQYLSGQQHMTEREEASDRFIAETHFGDMQFLHAMNSDGDPQENYKKQLQWARLCLDVQRGKFNTGDAARKTLSDVSGDYGDIFEGLGGSKYANMPVNNFFKNADNSYFSTNVGNDNYGMIAIGSMLHMLEDSFADSHAIRSVNLNQDWFKDPNTLARFQSPDFGNSRDPKEFEHEITKRLTRIIVHADYTEQDSGIHHQSDLLDGTIANTQGAAQATVVVAYVLKKVRQMNEAADEQKDQILNEIMDFIKLVLLPEGVDKPERAKDAALPVSVFPDNEEFDPANDLEAGGRAYEKMEWADTLTGDAKSAIEDYKKCLKEERGNHVHRVAYQLRLYARELEDLKTAYTDGNTLEPARNEIKKHANEIRINVISMKKQSPGNHNQIIQEINQRLANIRLNAIP